MTTSHTPTLLGLMLLGFMLVALPLVGTIATALFKLDEFADDGREALTAVQQNASLSRALADRLTEAERAARQYQALGDSAYKALYHDHRREVRLLFKRLQGLNQEPSMAPALAQASRSEAAAHAALEGSSPGITPNQLEAAFALQHADALALVQAYNALARDLGRAMPERAGELRTLLMSQAALVIPLSVAFAALFSALITRPVKQLDRSIRLLGQGALNEPVEITGTRDLEELGHRLDWLRRRLLELEAQHLRFLRNVSHELKTPLTNIREGAELLLEETQWVTGNAAPTGSTRERQTISRILHDNSLRLQQMIEALLRHGAGGDGAPKATDHSHPLDQLVHEALDELALTVHARSIITRTELDPAMVAGNLQQLRAIIGNLLSNAVKYAPEHSEITLSLTIEDDIAMLDVRDQGPGVRPEDAAHLFEWFFTGPRPAAAMVAGSGMGLAIADDYARQHGGNIALIESASGAHFRLTLPGRAYEHA